MSRTFYVKNTQAPKVMSTEELLSVAGGDFRQFVVSQDKENFKEVMQMPLNKFGYMLFGQEGISGRGFEVSYQEGEPAAYEVRVFTPSTERDWLGAMEFMSKLAIYLQVDIIDEEGMEYKANHITYNYRGDIEFGVRCYEGEREESFIFGVCRPIALNAEIVGRLLSAQDKVKAFSDFVESQQQHEDIFIANQIFYQNDKGEIIGTYTLTKTVPTVLPYQYPPFIDITKTDLQQEDILQWRISLVDTEGGEDGFNYLGDLDYKTFLERLPQEKIKKLDGHYMLLQMDTTQQMEALLGKTSLLGKIKNFFK